MHRRQMLALVATTGVSGVTGCSTLQGIVGSCPDNPIVDSSIPPNRRAIRFLAEEERPVKPSEPPLVMFEPANSRVVIKGVFVGATPKSVYEKDMILVDRLQYDEQADTLRVRLVEQECRSGGAPVGGETAPYLLWVRFPDTLPGRVCVQERGGKDKKVCVSQ